MSSQFMLVTGHNRDGLLEAIRAVAWLIHAQVYGGHAGYAYVCNIFGRKRGVLRCVGIRPAGSAKQVNHHGRCVLLVAEA